VIDETAEIEFLGKALVSGNHKQRIHASKRLSEIGGNSVLELLIKLLELGNDSVIVRNWAALTLMDIGNSDAVEPLFKAILKAENINYNGTMVHALWELDCSRKFKELFHILLYHGYEAKIMAYHILMKHAIIFSKTELDEVIANWQELKSGPRSNEDMFDEETEEVITYYISKMS
jgi:hypothetical protein